MVPLILGAALIGGGMAVQGHYSNKASKRQAKAAAAAAEEMRQARTRGISYQMPYYQAGNLGLAPLTGLVTGKQYDPSTGRTTQLTEGQQAALFQKSPGYQFRLEQAQNAIQASQAAKGGLLSGGAMKELSQFSQGVASDEYNNYINNLLGLTGIGQQAATSMGNIEVGAGSQVAAYTQNEGTARAMGYAARGNMYGPAMTGLGSQLFGLGLQQAMTDQPGAGGAGASGGTSRGLDSSSFGSGSNTTLTTR